MLTLGFSGAAALRQTSTKPKQFAAGTIFKTTPARQRPEQAVVSQMTRIACRGFALFFSPRPIHQKYFARNCAHSFARQTALYFLRPRFIRNRGEIL